MPSSDNINDALKKLLTGLDPNSAFSRENRCGNKNSGSNEPAGTARSDGATTNGSGINPSQILIISAILAGVLEVTSVLVDRNQTIEIVLSGSLKRKTELEKLLDQIGSKTFDEVVRAMLGRLGIP